IWFYINDAVVAADPVSGDIVVINAIMNNGNYTGQIEFWSYSPGTDTWVQLNSSVVPDTGNWWQMRGDPFSVVATPVSTYGVIMFRTADAVGGNSKVYLYKHAP